MLRITLLVLLGLALTHGFGIHGNGNGNGGNGSGDNNGNGNGVNTGTGPTGVPPTRNDLDCAVQSTELTRAACKETSGYINGGLIPHPESHNWYINCNARAICQPCAATTQFNIECQMCLTEGEECPGEAPKPSNLDDCYDDGCPFCSTLMAFEAHSSRLNYCQCLMGYPMCRPCPCGTSFDPKQKCCVTDFKHGRKCPQYGNK